MTFGWISKQSVEIPVLCIRDLEEGSDDFKLAMSWASPSSVLPKKGKNYLATIITGVRLVLLKRGHPILATVFIGLIADEASGGRDRLIGFNSVDSFNRYFTIQRD
jgi:hypothetical protein